jgi:hypothetical protein
MQKDVLQVLVVYIYIYIYIIYIYIYIYMCVCVCELSFGQVDFGLGSLCSWLG